MALHQHPQYRRKLQETEAEEYINWFVQEIRRYYPFAPFMKARVREEFQWREHTFHKGTKVFLDIYGTTHDSRLWKKP
jgi:fatty-acid peroxygenase